MFLKNRLLRPSGGDEQRTTFGSSRLDRVWVSWSRREFVHHIAMMILMASVARLGKSVLFCIFMLF